MHVVINVPKKAKLIYDDRSQKVVAGVRGQPWGRNRGAGRSMKELSKGMATLSTLCGWWLYRCIQLSKVTKLNTYDLCILLYMNYS